MCRKLPLKILVWGPGDPGPNASPAKVKAYKKRVQIKEEIEKNFPNAEVFAHEDPVMAGISVPGMPGLEAEAFQAFLADLIVVFDPGRIPVRGVYSEIDHFIPTYPWVRDKIYVLLPEAHVRTRSLVREVYDYLKPNQLVGYTSQEYKVCKVATEKSVAIAETKALEILMRTPTL